MIRLIRALDTLYHEHHKVAQTAAIKLCLILVGKDLVLVGNLKGTEMDAVSCQFKPYTYCKMHLPAGGSLVV